MRADGEIRAGGEDRATVAYVSVGSNMGDARRNAISGLRALAAARGLQMLGASSLYETEPVGCEPGQRNYVNAAAKFLCERTPEEMLGEILRVEEAHGRVREGRRNRPRTLDLDLLLWGEERMDQPELTLPHPRLHERAFVLVPLIEIAPDLRMPDGRAVSALLDSCGRSGVRMLERPRW